jgi:hypothetical protein
MTPETLDNLIGSLAVGSVMVAFAVAIIWMCAGDAIERWLIARASGKRRKQDAIFDKQIADLKIALRRQDRLNRRLQSKATKLGNRVTYLEKKTACKLEKK